MTYRALLSVRDNRPGRQRPRPHCHITCYDRSVACICLCDEAWNYSMRKLRQTRTCPRMTFVPGNVAGDVDTFGGKLTLL